MKRLFCISMLLVSPISWGTSSPEMIPVEPKQLYDLIAESDRMVVKESPMKGAQTLYESSTPAELKSFSDCLVITKPTPEEYFHCMCIGAPAIYFYKGTNETVHLTNHHGQSVRCSLWSSDVAIADIEKWISWFDEHGISSIRKEVEDAKTREQQSQKDWDRWIKAMPQCLEPIWEKSIGNYGMVNTKPLSKKLKEELPDQTQRILALLEWYGSGAGRWSGFPSYEDAVETMLLEYATTEIISAIQSTDLTTAQIEGGARLFGGWSFSKKRPNEINEVPTEMKQMFWNHVKSTKDEDKLGRAKRAFTK